MIKKIEEENKVVIYKKLYSYDQKYEIVQLDTSGKVIDKKIINGRFPFRRHKLVGGPLDGTIVLIPENQAYYDVRQSDGRYVKYGPSVAVGGHKKHTFNFQGYTN